MNSRSHEDEIKPFLKKGTGKGLYSLLVRLTP